MLVIKKLIFLYVINKNISCMRVKMKKISLLICMFILFSVINVNAQLFNFNKTIRFGAGIFTSAAIHEFSHMTIAYIRDIEPVEVINFKLRSTSSQRNDVWYSLAGLIGQNVSSEIILQTPKERIGSYLTGMLIGNVISSLHYPLFSYNNGDLGEIDLNHTQKDFVCTALVLNSFLTLYRMQKKKLLNFETFIGYSSTNETPTLGFSCTF